MRSAKAMIDSDFPIALRRVMRSQVQAQEYWYLRVKRLVGGRLSPRPDACWREAHPILQAALLQPNPYNSEAIEHELSLSVLLELGYPPFANDSLAIRLAVRMGALSSVRILLADGRADPGAQNNVCLLIACYNGYTEIVRLLLADTRVDPTEHNAAALCCAQERNRDRFRTGERAHIDIVMLLLSDWRLASYTI